MGEPGGVFGGYVASICVQSFFSDSYLCLHAFANLIRFMPITFPRKRFIEHKINDEHFQLQKVSPSDGSPKQKVPRFEDDVMQLMQPPLQKLPRRLSSRPKGQRLPNASKIFNPMMRKMRQSQRS